MTWDDWRKVTNPKVQGSWNLHLALPKGLDFFIMTASISSVMGLISQVNYGAANSYLDALACFRIGEGQKAVSLNLGLLGEEGFLKEATPHKLDRLLRTGYYTPLSRNDTLAIFDYYCNPDLGLLPPSECQPVIGIRTPTEIVARNRELPPAMRQPLWNLFPLTTSISIEKSITDLRVDLSQMIKNADSPAEVANIVGEALMKQVSNILATPLEGIEFHNAVSSYGIDSLTAVELRNWVSKTFQVEVAVFDIMGGASFATIGNIIAKNV
jgi:acyl carrier protein